MPSHYIRAGYGIAIEGLTTLNVTNQRFTLACWLRRRQRAGLSNTTALGDLLWHGGISSSPMRNGYWWGIGGRAFTVRVADSLAFNSQALSSSALAYLGDGAWYHCAVSYRERVTTQFVNGIAVGRTLHNQDIEPTPTPYTYIAGTNVLGSMAAVEAFDLRVIPNYAATPTEVRWIMDPRNKLGAERAIWWSLGHASNSGGQLVRDESGSGNDFIGPSASLAGVGTEPPYHKVAL